MVFMYTFNGKKNDWWEDITLLVWGASTKLLSYDVELQQYVAAMKEQGVRVIACKACAEQWGVADKLQEVGVEVFYTGTFLTEWIKSGAPIVTF